MALKTGRTELSEGTGRTRAAQTADAGKLKKERRKEQIFGEERLSIFKVCLGSCCTEAQLVTNLVQMVGINALQVAYFTRCLHLTESASETYRQVHLICGSQASLNSNPPC